jgi:hypothetical protein
MDGGDIDFYDQPLEEDLEWKAEETKKLEREARINKEVELKNLFFRGSFEMNNMKMTMGKLDVSQMNDESFKLLYDTVKNIYASVDYLKETFLR